jgi:trehalose 6-phosphate phosphatase
MTPLFSRTSLMILESLSFTKTLYCFDFDGTLSKIVRSPSDATISSRTTDLLRKLSELVPVAVISGRSMRDLTSRLGFKPQYIVGNHGIEGLGKNGAALVQAAKICSAWKEQLQGLNSGTELEDKTYSLALHYRRSRNKALSRESIANAITDLSPTPHVIRGKSVVNLLPPDAPHKGIAVLELLRKSEMKHVFYIGDDDTDEDVFSLPESNGQMFTVRVARKSSSQAKHYIERQSEINKVLETIIGYHLATKNHKNGSGRTKWQTSI